MSRPFPAADPGFRFEKQPGAALDLDVDFPASSHLCPRVVALPEGGYRLYYAEFGPICPPGTLGVIVSAFSRDGDRWEKEPGVRFTPSAEAMAKRVLAPDLVSLPGGGWRLYVEGRSQEERRAIFSAISPDGLNFTLEPGARLLDRESPHGYGTPCCVPLEAGGVWRLYYYHYDGSAWAIRSARSQDGIDWRPEPGDRVVQTLPEESYAVYSPHVIRLANGGWRMYYAGWSDDREMRGCILAADSADGLAWRKYETPVLVPAGDESAWDGKICSEPTLFRDAAGRWRLLYEACNREKNWRILSAVMRPPLP